MTINGKSISYVADGSATVAIVLAGLVAAWNSISTTVPPEIQEYTAAGVPAAGPFTSMTVTAKVAGKPGTISVGAGGATFSITNTTAGTGPNSFDNAANWSGGAPANSDVLVFDYGNVACKYNLATSLTGIVLQVKDGYSGEIGLPSINQDSTSGTNQYSEYRTTALTLAGGTAVINSRNISRCNIAFGANTALVTVTNTGRRVENDVPVVLITGGNGSSRLNVTKGDVGVAFYAGTTAQFPTITTSYVDNVASDVFLHCGEGATLGSVAVAGGLVRINNDVTALTLQSVGGTIYVDAGEITALDVQAGTVYYNSIDELTDATVSGTGTLSFDQDPNAKTVANPIEIYGDNAKIIDNQKVVNSGTLSFKLNQTTKMNVWHGTNNSISMT